MFSYAIHQFRVQAFWPAIAPSLREMALWNIELLVDGVWTPCNGPEFWEPIPGADWVHFDSTLKVWYSDQVYRPPTAPAVITLQPASNWSVGIQATAVRFTASNLGAVAISFESVDGTFGGNTFSQIDPPVAVDFQEPVNHEYTFGPSQPGYGPDLLDLATDYFQAGHGWAVDAHGLAFSGTFSGAFLSACGLTLVRPWKGGLDYSAKGLLNALVQLQGQSLKLSLGVLGEGLQALGTPVLCPANTPTQLVARYNPKFPGSVDQLVVVPMYDDATPLHVHTGQDVTANLGIVALEALPVSPDSDAACFWTREVQAYQYCEAYQPDPPPPPEPPPPEPGPKDGLRLVFVTQAFSSFGYNLRITYGAGNTDLFDFPAKAWIPSGNGMSVVDAHTAHVGSGQGGNTEIRFEAADKHFWFISSIPGVRPATLTFTITLDSPYDGSSSLSQTLNFIAAGGSWNVFVAGGSGNFNLDCSAGVAPGQTVITRTVTCYWQP